MTAGVVCKMSEEEYVTPPTAPIVVERNWADPTLEMSFVSTHTYDPVEVVCRGAAT